MIWCLRLTGKTTFLLYLLFYRLERGFPHRRSIHRKRVHSFRCYRRVNPRRTRVHPPERLLGSGRRQHGRPYPLPCTSVFPRTHHLHTPLFNADKWDKWVERQGAQIAIADLPKLLEIAAIACVYCTMSRLALRSQSILFLRRTERRLA